MAAGRDKVSKLRLDELLVRRSLFSTTDEALRAIMAGDVSAAGRRLSFAGERVREDLDVHVRGGSAYVGRGGLKLERGLEAFGVDPTGLACLDVGCSTGGFTDCLLRHGARSVLAVDVGYAQFAWSLRCDARVELLERTNVVDLPTPERAGSIDLAVCDVSFTSVRTVLPAVAHLLASDGSFLTLVKPQFEAARADVGEGGVVRDADVQVGALRSVAAACVERGLSPRAACPSPLRGHKGNREFLLLARAAGRGAEGDLDLEAVVLRGACVVA
ncbi:TlyA family RNA methyltransferase [Olsenella massiliensis]|uniref:TlyA family RNA methyltransferase n=1 Tax=Olsenella massiliensis TaxID=1622075 RepID=UPI000AA322F6|nr:TlyA family RNA methyltransferase [Olsenella massiliensis]